MLSLNGISRAFGPEPLFKDLSFVIEPDSRIGLIGRNGSGKSTLLKIIAGLEHADHGDISCSGKWNISYVEQKQNFPQDLCAREILLEKCYELGLDSEQSHSRVGRALAQTEFRDSELPVSQLSGGWQKRLSIACGLLCEPDLLLLDEPTNHLDFQSILWLERLLQKSQFACLIVSHDRMFLERIANSMLELGSHYPRGFFRVSGGYTRFLEARDAYFVELDRQYTSLKAKVKEERAWMGRSPQARTGKARYRIEQVSRLSGELAGLNKLLNNPQENFSFSSSGRKTKELIECRDVCFGYDTSHQLISDFTFTLKEKMCVGILGANGSGKSTLLKLMTGELKHESGRIRRAKNLNFALLDQMRERIDGGLTLKEALCGETDGVLYQGQTVHEVSWARRFRFNREQLIKLVADLSGGEKARILLAHIVRQEADVLILDEPTNDLDIDMIELLERSLLNFEGSVLLVSHDRYLLEELCTHFIGILPNGEIGLFADYFQWEAEFARQQRDLQKIKTFPKSQERNIAQETKPRKLSFKEKYELEGMEQAIEKAEAELQDLLAQAQKAQSFEAQQRNDLFHKIHGAEQKISNLYERWQELDSKKS